MLFPWAPGPNTKGHQRTELHLFRSIRNQTLQRTPQDSVCWVEREWDFGGNITDETTVLHDTSSVTENRLEKQGRTHFRNAECLLIIVYCRVLKKNSHSIFPDKSWEMRENIEIFHRRQVYLKTPRRLEEYFVWSQSSVNREAQTYAFILILTFRWSLDTSIFYYQF